MDVRNLIAKLSAAVLHRRAASSPILFRPIRNSLADIPLKPAPRPPYRPHRPIWPASNM
ncbi:hypothetical protein NKH34_14815 [Mesorhizobium sp. M1148]|uniref:hypothetical protein n=1 Tax=unclassified Mesorhizobium TaxID=325217 RepID=UPI0003CE8058|nr:MULTISPECIES: hypothetical protein [unclassified Mesorhizobium]ESW78230.1 hypothetical protein X773_20945 [Mesorhizobium sp. LSJC285A00]ESW82842.1 hypothetical protein X770_27080 [Mesorhizobium sp. LSJC269B00]ESX08728.1 hypothetical protein X768_21830 [Mesorhizobium sp. LSJC265A00]ESX10932.1 hypothetical protein X766_32110 [Mesorhizobium sp. LSJC255A00]ESX24702.1 hypothetical protein X767_11355 [Mesorhizobium sp. LSJC264A00]